MKGSRVARQSAHTLAEAIMVFYERERLFPRGVHRSMDCVQSWALRMGGALKKMAARLDYLSCFISRPSMEVSPSL